MTDVSEEPSTRQTSDELIRANTQQRMASLTKVLRFVGAGVALLALVGLIYVLLSWLSSDEPKVNAPIQGEQSERAVNETGYARDTAATGDSLNTNEAREQFKQALLTFEQDWQLILDDPALRAWRAQGVDDIQASKTSALSAFANASFGHANQLLAQASASAQTLKQEWDAAFSNSLNLAQQAFDNEQANPARLHLSQAETIKPQAPEVQALRQRLSALSSVQALLEQARVAEIENNPSKQMAALQEVLRLDPQRSELNAQLQALKVQQAEQYIAQQLQLAWQALADDDIGQAQQAFDRLSAIAAERETVKALAAQIRQKRAVVAKQSLLQEIQADAAADRWQAVNSKGSAGLQQYAKDPLLRILVDKSQAVLAIQGSLASYIARPERLLDEGIRERAKNALRTAIPLLPASPTIAQQVRELSQQIDLLSSKVPVTVLSDKRTHILVLGVGVVGSVDKKEISLLPGTYRLEGQCKGYKSKIVELTVSPLTQNQEITVVCDERI